MVPLPTIVAWPPTVTSVIRPSCLCAVPSRALGAPHGHALVDLNTVGAVPFR
jgi:hypothetical protein